MSPVVALSLKGWWNCCIFRQWVHIYADKWNNLWSVPYYWFSFYRYLHYIRFIYKIYICTALAWRVFKFNYVDTRSSFWKYTIFAVFTTFLDAVLRVLSKFRAVLRFPGPLWHLHFMLPESATKFRETPETSYHWRIPLKQTYTNRWAPTITSKHGLDHFHME